MQSWFPHLTVQRYPPVSELPKILSSYEMFLVIQNDSDEFVLRLIQEGKRRFPEKIKVIYLYPSPNIVNEPYYSDCLTDPKLPIAENFRRLCEKVLHLPKLTKSNGMIPPVGLVQRKFEKRVVIHPTSSRPSKNWPKEKFVKLALHLKERGYEVVFVPGSEEIENWKNIGFEVASFNSLDLLSRFIYESGYLVGNDSGLAHIASSIGIPTLTFSRRKSVANLWAPSFHKGIALTPSSWIPNIRGFRFRDKYWKNFISVKKACRAFDRLSKKS